MSSEKHLKFQQFSPVVRNCGAIDPARLRRRPVAAPWALAQSQASTQFLVGANPERPETAGQRSRRSRWPRRRYRPDGRAQEEGFVGRRDAAASASEESRQHAGVLADGRRSGGDRRRARGAEERACRWRCRPNVAKDHFRVLEDGVPQKIQSVTQSEAPITAVLLVEFSESNYNFMYDALNASYAFASSLKPQDWVAVVEFDMKEHILVDFTQDKQAIFGALNRLHNSRLPRIEPLGCHVRHARPARPHPRP